MNKLQYSIELHNIILFHKNIAFKYKIIFLKNFFVQVWRETSKKVEVVKKNFIFVSFAKMYFYLGKNCRFTNEFFLSSNKTHCIWFYTYSRINRCFWDNFLIKIWVGLLANKFYSLASWACKIIYCLQWRQYVINVFYISE